MGLNIVVMIKMRLIKSKRNIVVMIKTVPRVILSIVNLVVIDFK